VVAVAFAVLVGAAAGVRLLTYDRYLPYLDYSDETVPFLVARNMRGLFDDEFVEWRYAGYPPAYPIVNIGVQILVETFALHPWTVPPDYFFALRVLAVWIGVVSVLVVASIAWQLAGPVAAWFAGFIWALAPVITEHNNLAIPDPFVYFTCGLALTTALYGWRVESPRWLTVSLLMGILAIYFKLWPIHALIPWGVVTLILLVRRRWKLLPWLVCWAGLGLVSAGYLFLRIRPLDTLPAREIMTFNEAGIQNMLTPQRSLINGEFAIYPVGSALFFAVIFGSALAFTYSRRRGWRRLDMQRIALLLFYSVAGLVMASSFTQVRLEAGKIRHVLPVTVALLPVWGAGLAQIIWTTTRWFRERGAARRQQLLAPIGVFGLIFLVTLPSFVSGHVTLVKNFGRADMRAVLWQWADVNVPLDGMILIHPNSDAAFTWNRPWSGYDGSKPFEYWLEVSDEIAVSTPERFVERGITYFVMTETDRTDIFTTPQLQAFVEQLTLIKTLHAAPNIRGVTTYFYRMLPPHYAVAVSFGDQINLVGYDLTAQQAAPGDTILFRPYWRAERRPDTNYSMFVHFYPADEEHLITQFDGSPASEQRLTLTWADPDELIIGTEAVLMLPMDIEPGDYRLAVGLYDFSSGHRLASDTGETFFSIPITITPGVSPG
jgi:hypothetical protein